MLHVATLCELHGTRWRHNSPDIQLPASSACPTFLFAPFPRFIFIHRRQLLRPSNPLLLQDYKSDTATSLNALTACSVRIWHLCCAERHAFRTLATRLSGCVRPTVVRVINRWRTLPQHADSSGRQDPCRFHAVQWQCRHSECGDSTGVTHGLRPIPFLCVFPSRTFHRLILFCRPLWVLRALSPLMEQCLHSCACVMNLCCSVCGFGE